MDIHRYKANSLYTIVKITANSINDDMLLNSIIEFVKARETWSKRVRDAQLKMHEATTELAEIKKSWVYKVIKFIKGDA